MNGWESFLVFVFGVQIRTADLGGAFDASVSPTVERTSPWGEVVRMA